MFRSPATRRLLAFAHTVVLAAALAGAAWASPPADAAATEAEAAAAMSGPATDSGKENPPAAPALRAPLTPRMREIVAAWDAHVLVVLALEARLREATDHADAIELEREIENARRDVEVEILRIQARYARDEGRFTDAAEIDAAIAVITSPPPRGTPVERPAPEPAPR